MGNKLSISIITPTFNRADELDCLLRSISKQTYGINKRILSSIIILPISLFFILKGGNYIVSFLYAILILGNFEAFSAFKRKNRKIYLQDAFISFLCSAGAILIILSINTLATIYDSAFIGPGTFKTPNTSWSLKSLNANYPILDFLLNFFCLNLSYF